LLSSHHQPAQALPARVYSARGFPGA
jgi:hypothetical protein